MARLHLARPISDGATATAPTLHHLISPARLAHLASAAREHESQLIVSRDTPPDPAEFKFWYISDYHYRILRVWHSSASCWVTVGPDCLEIALRNDTGDTLKRGALVLPSGPSSFGIATGASINVIGFTPDTAASGAYVGVAYVGIGFVHVTTNASSSANMQRGALVHNIGSAPGDATATGGIASGVPGTEFYELGILLDNARAATSDLPQDMGFRALIRGPRTSRSL